MRYFFAFALFSTACTAFADEESADLTTISTDSFELTTGTVGDDPVDLTTIRVSDQLEITSGHIGDKPVQINRWSFDTSETSEKLDTSNNEDPE